MKLWIAGSVAQFGEEENIRELVKTFKYFDGACFTVNYIMPELANSQVCVNETYDLLNLHKKEGLILWNPWVNINSIPMTVALQCGKIKLGDWVLFVDAQELPKEQFLKDLRQNIEKWDREGICSVWWGRPYIFKFFEFHTFQPTSVHCMLHPIVGGTLSIQDESKVVYDEGGVHFGDFIYNKKKKENSMLLHGVKYCLFNVTNQMSMFYKGKELEAHENNRFWFCLHLEYRGYERTLDGLEKFFREKKNLTKEVVDYLNWEFVFRDFYRYKILGHSLDEIMQNRYNYKIGYEI